MTNQEILAMANEAGLNSCRIPPSEVMAVWGRFASLVSAKEREECAQVCDELVIDHPGRADMTAMQCATAIRAQGSRE